MVKILHGADFHLDTRFESLPGEKSKEQRREQRRLLFEMAELVKKENVRLVLLSGDLLDSDLSYYETYEALSGALEEMAVPVFIAPGNHDYYTSRSPYAAGKFPKNVRIFTRPEIESVTVPDLGVTVWGAAFTAPRSLPLLEGFRAPESELVNIMALHGELGGESYAPIDEKSIGDTNLDYLALGHVHAFSGIKRCGNTFYAYPGCPMGRGFDETGKKGVIIGTVGKGSADLRFEPLSAREYRIIKAGQDELEGVIPDDGLNTVCRLILTGKWDGKPEIGKLCDRLGDRFYHLTVVDETAPDEDIWLGLDEDNLRGLFLRRMREKYDAPGADKGGIMLATEYGIAAFDNREGVE